MFEVDQISGQAIYRKLKGLNDKNIFVNWSRMLGEHVWSFSQAGSFSQAHGFYSRTFLILTRLNLSAGYNYYGTERMYSGTDGREFEADIFFGVVYYQRLRHMVADKYQVIKKVFSLRSPRILVSLCVERFRACEWWHHVMRVIWLALTAVSRGLN